MADEVKQLIDMVAKLRVTMVERFEKVDRKLEEHDRRFERIDEKLEEHDRRFERIDEKLEEHDRRFERIDEKLEEHDRGFDKVEAQQDEMKTQMKKLDKNQIKIINTINIFKHDIVNNKKHIEKLENNDDYLKISE